MKFLTPDARFGATLESLLDRRDRLALTRGGAYGSTFVGKQLIEAVLAYIKPGQRLLEVDAGPGLFTRLFLSRGADVVALEPSHRFAGELRALAAEGLTHRAGDQEHVAGKLRVVEGFTEDLPIDERYDLAVVTFPARRGVGLLSLINELAPMVDGPIVVVMPDDGSLDWAYLCRAAAIEGAESHIRFIAEGKYAGSRDLAEVKRAVLLVVERLDRIQPMRLEHAWDLQARTIDVPYPVPRGAATRLVRYFIAGGDRSVIIKTDAIGLNRLHGNLRTAAHRIARDEVTVRRIDDGIQLMLIPKAPGER